MLWLPSFLIFALAALVDARTRRLPNALIAAGWAAGLLAQLLWGSWASLPWQALGTIGAGLAMGLFVWASRGRFGMGDAKLISAMAFFLSPLAWCGMLLLACLAALLFYGGRVALLWLRTRTSPAEAVQWRLPFGPFLVFGYFVSGVLEYRGFFQLILN